MLNEYFCYHILSLRSKGPQIDLLLAAKNLGSSPRQIAFFTAARTVRRTRTLRSRKTESRRRHGRNCNARQSGIRVETPISLTVRHAEAKCVRRGIRINAIHAWKSFSDDRVIAQSRKPNRRRARSNRDRASDGTRERSSTAREWYAASKSCPSDTDIGHGETVFAATTR